LVRSPACARANRLTMEKLGRLLRIAGQLKRVLHCVTVGLIGCHM